MDGSSVLGIDETGVGAWAGPLVVVGVVLDPDQRVEGVHDSKLMTRVQREAVVPRIMKEARFWTWAYAGPPRIDRDGIWNVWSELCVQIVRNARAVLPCSIRIDGGRPVEGIPRQEQHCIVNGDLTVPAISAASVLAKVIRDRYMFRLAHRPEYEAYDFEANQGYGTPQHQVALQAYGPSPIHRRSYKPVASVGESC
jgi:ribonuclease HII